MVQRRDGRLHVFSHSRLSRSRLLTSHGSRHLSIQLPSAKLSLGTSLPRTRRVLTLLTETHSDLSRHSATSLRRPEHPLLHRSRGSRGRIRLPKDVTEAPVRPIPPSGRILLAPQTPRASNGCGKDFPRTYNSSFQAHISKQIQGLPKDAQHSHLNL